MTNGSAPSISLRRADAALGIAGVGGMALLAWGVAAGSILACLVAGVLMALTVVLAGSLNLNPNNTHSQATERKLRIASNTL